MTRALIVDDNASNLYMLRTLLECNGFLVDQAYHGAEALVKARQNPPDIIVSDLLMPVLDGYGLLRHWRSDERLSSIPFIVYTATYTEPRDEQLAMALGADAFIIKPAEPEPLMARIREVVASLVGKSVPARNTHRPADGPLLTEYNAVLFTKLEKKALQLEQTNARLMEEIAERRRTESALRASEERFRATFEQAAVGIAHIGTDGNFLRVNDKLCEITGYSRDELLQLGFAELNRHEDRSPDDDTFAAVLTGSRKISSAQARHLKKNRATFWASTILSIVQDEAGLPGYFIFVMIDITDHKALEDQLRQSQKMEAIGRLAGGIAHDFNNLLTIVSGYSEAILITPALQPAVRESAEAIRDAGDRASALTRQLLGFSRQTLLQPKVLDLNAALHEGAKLLRRLIGENIEVATAFAPNLSRVKVDPSHLDQVLINLAINARDAMPQGGRLAVETDNVVLDSTASAAHPDRKPGRFVRLALTDTGCGMTPDVMARIFEPFFTTKEIGKGTGLGLAMVFGIVKQSGGWIEADSKPGHGSTFRIYLPAADAPLPATAGSGIQQAVHGTETILFVEDDASVRKQAVTSLRNHGYRVLSAADGNEALTFARAQARPPDLLMTDIIMPNLGGPELASRIRARFPQIKVMFMSGHADEAVVRQGLLDAGVAFIQKPYTPTMLAQKVRQVLDGSGIGK